ncbi:MAG: hypothetical protein HYZ28_10065 [Myxococcales bacterium]|nr:hypothetical protein [Myxococcales bacterium]
MERRKGLLEPVRNRVRRLQLTVGLGFAAVVVGSIVSASLTGWLGPLVRQAGSAWLAIFAHALVSRLWVYGVLPGLCYASARAFDLRPWRTAIGSALTGEVFVVGVNLATGGMEEPFRNWLDLSLRLLSLAAGVVLGRWAVLKGRSAAQRAHERAAQAAEARKAQYEEFAAEAARLAARREEKPISPASEAPTEAKKDGTGTG